MTVPQDDGHGNVYLALFRPDDRCDVLCVFVDLVCAPRDSLVVLFHWAECLLDSRDAADVRSFLAVCRDLLLFLALSVLLPLMMLHL